MLILTSSKVSGDNIFTWCRLHRSHSGLSTTQWLCIRPSMPWSCLQSSSSSSRHGSTDCLRFWIDRGKEHNESHFAARERRDQLRQIASTIRSKFDSVSDSLRSVKTFQYAVEMLNVSLTSTSKEQLQQLCNKTVDHSQDFTDSAYVSLDQRERVLQFHKLLQEQLEPLFQHISHSNNVRVVFYAAWNAPIICLAIIRDLFIRYSNHPANGTRLSTRGKLNFSGNWHWWLIS